MASKTTASQLKTEGNSSRSVPVQQQMDLGPSVEVSSDQPGTVKSTKKVEGSVQSTIQQPMTRVSLEDWTFSQWCKGFVWKDEQYLRVIPAKPLFRSTMVHDVVNRGDVFAVRLRDMVLTIVPGTAEVEHVEPTILWPL